jgi:hypothetical protein
MRERPFGPELLDVARRVLRERLLPRLPADCRYDALMVANAMGIAARDAEAGTAPLLAELEGLANLYGSAPPQATTQQQLFGALRAANQRLARDIRAGSFTDRDPAVRAHLRRSLEDQLAVSNPKAVGGRRAG